MKTLLILTAFSILTATAFTTALAKKPKLVPQEPTPETLLCESFNSTPDIVFSLEFSNSMNSATLTKTTETGAEVLSVFRCDPIQVREPNDGQYDQIVNINNCYEPNLADAGYSVRVNSGGFAGITIAEIYEISFFGTTYLASLVCNFKH
jgi:hypothetical protein